MNFFQKVCRRYVALMISLVTTVKFLSPADNLLLDEIYILFSIKSKPAFFHFHPSKSTTHSLSFCWRFGLEKHANIDTTGLLCVVFRFFFLSVCLSCGVNKILRSLYLLQHFSFINRCVVCSSRISAKQGH